MLDNFREWLSDNLRYILLGLAAILLIVIAFFAFRLVKGLGSPKEKPDTVQTEAGTEEAETEKSVQNGESLQKDQKDVLAWVTQYYDAKESKDYDALGKLCEKFDDAARTEVEAQDAAVEAYNNIMTYSKAGLTEGSYIVYAYFDAKVTGSETLVPSLREFYLIKNAEGSLVRADMTAEMKALVEERRKDDDVQALLKDVNKKYDEVIASDDALAALLAGESDNSGDARQGQTDANGTDGEPVTGTTTGTMQTTTEVNVRGEASAEATLYGVLTAGTSVEVLENLDSGWSKISYTSNGNTVEGYIMTQYLTAVQ